MCTRTHVHVHLHTHTEDRDLSAALVAIGFPDRVGQLQKGKSNTFSLVHVVKSTLCSGFVCSTNVLGH